MESGEKDDIKLRLGMVVKTIIWENKVISKENKGVKDHRLVDSLRKLAAASGIDFGNIQKMSTGLKNPSITTIVAIADGFDITLSEFFSYYDKITNAQINQERRKKKN